MAIKDQENNRKFSPERLFRIRRMRKARRLWKKSSLFAFAWMQEEFPGYAYPAFLDDLRRRTPKKRKEKKTPLCRFGRYAKMAQLLVRYHQTGKEELALQAIRLRKMMTKDYRLLVRLKREKREYFYSALISFQRIEQLAAAMNNATNWQEVEELDQAFRKTG